MTNHHSRPRLRAGGFDDALAHEKLARGDILALGGFSHAGDYAAAAIIRWRAA
jgi:hypothetical protein